MIHLNRINKTSIYIVSYHVPRQYFHIYLDYLWSSRYLTFLGLDAQVQGRGALWRHILGKIFWYKLTWLFPQTLDASFYPFLKFCLSLWWVVLTVFLFLYENHAFFGHFQSVGSRDLIKIKITSERLVFTLRSLYEKLLRILCSFHWYQFLDDLTTLIFHS